MCITVGPLRRALLLHKFREPPLRPSRVSSRFPKPIEVDQSRMKTLVFRDESRILFAREFTFHKRQIYILIPAIHFVSDDWMSNMTEVNPNLMFPPGKQHHANERENPPIANKCFHSENFGS